MTLSHLRQCLIVGLLVLCFCLTGCQSHSADDSVIRLTLWQGVNPPPNRDVLQKLVDRFNQQHPTIQVESLYVGQGDQQMPKILAAVVGNATPDLLWFAPMLTGQLVELESLRPLDAFLANSAVTAEIDRALFDTMQFDGHIWSIPFSTNNVGVFYRPSLLKAAGINQLPHTWAEFRQAARQLTRDTNGDGKIDQQGLLLPLGKGEWTVFTWLPFMWSAGGELSSPSTAGLKGLDITNTGAIAALQFWRSLIEDGTAGLSQPERGYELDGFLAGKVAMQLSGPWTLGQLQATQTDFGVMPIPTDKRSATVVGGENLFLFKSTPEREQAAFKFAEYVMSAEFQTEWAIGTGYLPINLKARESAAYQTFKAQQPAVEVFLQQAQYGRSRPIFPGYSRISDYLGRAIETTLLGQSDPTTALKAAQSRLNLIFGF